MKLCKHCFKELKMKHKQYHPDCAKIVHNKSKSLYYLNNKEKCKKRTRLWASKNKDKIREYANKYSRQKSAIWKSLPSDIRIKMLMKKKKEILEELRKENSK